jgi:hypothetical protein
MAEVAFPRTAFFQGQEVARVFVGGQEAQFIFGKGTQILPHLGEDITGWLSSRVVNDPDQRYFEIGFKMDGLLQGNAGAGWTDPGNYFRIEAEYSTDLVNWSMGRFGPAPVPIIANADGTYEYWARAINPIDSAVKSGGLYMESGNGFGGGRFASDPRNNPITGVTIAGIARTLTGPCTMPGGAAQLQADIIAAGFPGTIVTAASATLWSISIPSVNYVAFSQSSRVFWPTYLIADIFGALTVQVSGANFSGTFVNAAGVPIYEKAFARLKISTGTRYL